MRWHKTAKNRVILIDACYHKCYNMRMHGGANRKLTRGGFLVFCLKPCIASSPMSRLLRDMIIKRWPTVRKNTIFDQNAGIHRWHISTHTARWKASNDLLERGDLSVIYAQS